MNIGALAQIEARIIQLPLDEQLWLIERVTQHIREMFTQQSTFANQFALMANDPEIRSELQQIEREFSLTEADGLEGLA